MPETTQATAIAAAKSRDVRSLLGWAAGLATVTIWAFWIVGTRHAVTHHLPPAAIGLLRFAVPAVVLAPAALRSGPWPKGLMPRVGLGLLGSGAPFFVTVATGMRFAPAADIGPLLPGTMPLFVALIGWFVFGERFRRSQVVGFALIALGVLCIAGRGYAEAATGAWRGHLLLLSGAFLWGIYTHAYRRSGLSSLQAAGLIGLWSVVMLLPFGVPPLVGAVRDGLTAEILAQGILQGLLSGVAGLVLYGLAIDRLGPSRAAALSPLGPVLATLLAVPLLHEVPDRASLAGIGAASLGVLLASGLAGARR